MRRRHVFIPLTFLVSACIKAKNEIPFVITVESAIPGDRSKQTTTHVFHTISSWKPRSVWTRINADTTRTLGAECEITRKQPVQCTVENDCQK